MLLVRYSIKEHIIPFFAAFFVVTFLFVVNFLIKALDNILAKGLSWDILLQLLILNLAWMLALSIPMSVLVSCLMAFGRMSADHEITAVKAAGLSPWLMVRPIFIIGSLILVLMVVFNNWILPDANHRAGSLIDSIQRKKPQTFLSENALIKDFPGVQIWLDKIDRETGRLKGIQIWQTQRGQGPKITYADSGRIEYADSGATLLLHLYHGSVHQRDDSHPEKYFLIHFTHQTLAVETPDDQLHYEERSSRGDREMPIEQMWEGVLKSEKNMDSLTKQFIPLLFNDDTLLLKQIQKLHPSATPPSSWIAPDYNKIAQLNMNLRSKQFTSEQAFNQIDSEHRQAAAYRVEIHKKFSIPTACLVFVLIGASLGILARQGGVGVGAVFSLLFFVIYWAGLISGEQFGKKLLVTPWLSMWVPNLIVGLVAIILTFAVLNDRIQNINVFGIFWSWIKNKYRLQKQKKSKKIAMENSNV